MFQATLIYVGNYAIQTIAFVSMGLIWLANAMLLGAMINPDARFDGCGAGVLNIVALDLLQLATIGFFATAPLIAAFGYLASWLTKGKRSPYALLIFLAPLFGLVSQNVVWTSGSLRYYSNVLAPFALATLLSGLFFLPAFYFQRRLTRRCT